jgi:hypothetical protein
LNVLYGNGLLSPSSGDGQSVTTYVGTSVSESWADSALQLQLSSSYSSFVQGVTISLSPTPQFFSLSSSTPNSNGQVTIYIKSNGSGTSDMTSNYRVTATSVAFGTSSYKDCSVRYIPSAHPVGTNVTITTSAGQRPLNNYNSGGLLQYVANYGNTAFVTFQMDSSQSTIILEPSGIGTPQYEIPSPSSGYVSLCI